MNPFKKKSKAAQPAAPATTEPTKSAEQIVAEKTIARGARVKALSEEAAMWRSFSTGCKSGRWLLEHLTHYGLYMDAPPRLSLTMDDDSAQLWRDFAIRMAEDRERRLKDVLGF